MLKFATLGLLCAVATLLTAGNCDVLHDFKNCGSTGKINEVRILPCPASPCILKKNSNVGLEIDFQTNEITDTLKIKMFGILDGVPPLPWNGVAEKACDSATDSSGGPACPVKDANSVLHYKNSFHVSQMYPTVSLNVKVAITDAAGKTLVCFTFPVKIEK